VQIREFQELIERIYLAKDTTRGVDGTFRWFVEEVGELARAIRHREIHGTAPGFAERNRDSPGFPSELEGEFADVLAWLASLASQTGIDLEAAATGKYRHGCPKCRETPCACKELQATSHKPQAGRHKRKFRE
jgi:NTP pyrophosphatase (non-canonical NTP hydrolase)